MHSAAAADSHRLTHTDLPARLPVLQGLPRDGSAGTVAIYAAVLLCFALLKSWPAPACNNPLFAGELLQCIEGCPLCHHLLSASHTAHPAGRLHACLAALTAILY